MSDEIITDIKRNYKNLQDYNDLLQTEIETLGTLLFKTDGTQGAIKLQCENLRRAANLVASWGDGTAYQLTCHLNRHARAA